MERRWGDVGDRALAGAFEVAERPTQYDSQTVGLELEQKRSTQVSDELFNCRQSESAGDEVGFNGPHEVNRPF